MATAAILLTGGASPAKTLLGGQLAALLGCPVIPGAEIVEHFAALVGETVTTETIEELGMSALWSLAAAVPAGVVLDAEWSAAHSDRVRQGVALAGASRVVELWCEAFGDWTAAQPIGLWPVVRVDTTGTVDFGALLPELAAHLVDPEL